MTTPSTKLRLTEAIEIVNQQFGEGASEQKPELLAAIVNSLAIDALSETISQKTEKLADIIARSAAVASGS
jgi:hypothetical protein